MAHPTGSDGSADGTHSYGTTTYSGLLRRVHAKVKAGDPGVEAAVEWLSNRYTVAKNPGLGDQGSITTTSSWPRPSKPLASTNSKPAAGKVNWREELAKELHSLQRRDGSWSNTNGRWMEQDPVLATSYTVIALGTLCGE